MHRHTLTPWGNLAYQHVLESGRKDMVKEHEKLFTDSNSSSGSNRRPWSWGGNNICCTTMPPAWKICVWTFLEITCCYYQTDLNLYETVLTGHFIIHTYLVGPLCRRILWFYHLFLCIMCSLSSSLINFSVIYQAGWLVKKIINTSVPDILVPESTNIQIPHQCCCCAENCPLHR